MTETDPWDRHVKTTREHLEALRQLADPSNVKGSEAAPSSTKGSEAAPSSDQPAAMAEVLEALSTSLEDLVASHQAAEAERQRYQDLFEFAPDCCILTNTAGMVLEANRAAAALLHAPQRSLVGKPLVAFVADAAREELVACLAQLRDARPDEALNCELPMQSREEDGGTFTAAVTVTAMHGSQSGRSDLLWLMRGVAEHPQMEGTLRKSEALYHAIVEDQTELVCRFLPDGTLTFVNEAYCCYFGKERDELVGHSLMKLVTGRDQKFFEQQIASLSPENPVVTHEHRVVLPNGEVRWQRWTNRAIFDEHDRLIEFQSVGRDTTARRKLREERERLLAQLRRDRASMQELAEVLEKERHTLQTIMENTHAHLAYLDPQLNFVRVNSAYAKGAGYSKEELLGRNHFDLFPHTENQAIFERVRDTGQPVKFEAKPFVYPDRPELGTTYWDWTLVPVKDESGEVQGLVLSLLDVTERVQAEEALQESEKKYRQLVENLNEGIWVIDKDAYTTYVNPRMAEILGYTVDEMEGEHLFSFMDERGVETCERNLERREQGIKEQHDFEFIRKDGARVYALLETSPITDDNGNYAGALAGVQDITERRSAQEALQRNADLMRALHEIDQVILAAPRSAEEIAEAALPHIRQLVPCRRTSVAVFDLEANEMSLLAAHTGGEARVEPGARFSLEALGEDIEALRQGEVYTVEDIQSLSQPSPLIEALQAHGVRSYINVPLVAHGELIGSLNLGAERPNTFTPEHLNVAREVADQLAIGIQQACLYEQVQSYTVELEQRVAERTAELHASEKRFRTLFEEAAIGIALLDGEGRLVESNPALQATLGYSGQELDGMALRELCHPDDAPADFDPCSNLMAGTSDYYRAEKRFVRKDGHPVWANVTASLVRGTRDVPQFVICMVEDVTERKQAQAALLQAEKLAIAGKLAASLAHEINNPLQSVIGCLGLAEETRVEGGDVGRYLPVALEELRRVARIVARLRNLHRPSQPEEREPTDVNALLERVLALSRKKCEEHGVDVIRREDDDLPLIPLVPDRMQQVFLNLVLNALDAMPGGGRLEVGATHTDQPAGVRVTFVDDGDGIAPDALPHIFDLFYSTKTDGLGLGLSISQDIVKQHGGRIEVDSQVGEGTAFTVWLPA